jgi:preprotein translocase subunit SecA
VEGRNFGIRKNVLQYDDVMNQQREVIYAERLKVLNGENLRDSYRKMADEVAGSIINMHTGGGGAFVDDWDFKGMNTYAVSVRLPGGLFAIDKSERENMTVQLLKQKALDKLEWLYEQKENELTGDVMREIERMVLLRVVDEKWMDHIDAMDELRHGVGMRAYAQRDPIVEYRFEGFEMFEQMTRSISEGALSFVLRAKLQKGQSVKREKVAQPLTASLEDSESGGGGGRAAAGNRKVVQTQAKRTQKAGRNDPCPCGSGKKYKNCHGAVA